MQDILIRLIEKELSEPSRRKSRGAVIKLYLQEFSGTGDYDNRSDLYVEA